MFLLWFQHCLAKPSVQGQSLLNQIYFIFSHSLSFISSVHHVWYKLLIQKTRLQRKKKSKPQPTSFVCTAGWRAFWPCQFKTRAGCLNESQSEPLQCSLGLSQTTCSHPDNSDPSGIFSWLLWSNVPPVAAENLFCYTLRHFSIRKHKSPFLFPDHLSKT